MEPTLCMQPRVGMKIKIEYEGQWYYAEIKNVKIDSIVIKLWKTAWKNKLYDIPTWLDLVIQNKIKIITYQRFPKWVSCGKNVCIKDAYNNTTFHKICDYSDGAYISLIGIADTVDTSTNINTLQLINNRHFNLSTKNKNVCLHNQQIIIMPECHKIDNGYLFKKLSSIQQSQEILKSSSKIINNTITNNDIQHYKLGQFIEHSSKIYEKLLANDGNGLFPDEVNQIILSFLTEKIIFICPASLCIKKNVKKFWNAAQTRFIGCDFQMNTDVNIIGFKLYHDNIILNVYDMQFSVKQRDNNKYGIGYIAKRQTFDTYSNFIFDEPMELSTGKGIEYNILLTLDLDMIQTLFSWHYHESGCQNVQKWKIFQKMEWMEYSFCGSTAMNKKQETELKEGVIMSLFKIKCNWWTFTKQTCVFPHIAIIFE